MKTKAAWLWLCALAPAWPQGFVLDGERHTTYGVADSTRIFQAYSYDGQGNRVLKRSFDGADSSAAGLGSTSYLYVSGQLAREVTVSGSDTVSDIDYAYDLSARVKRVTVRGKGRVLRYADSMDYDGQGNRVSEARVLPGDSLSFILRHYYDGNNRVAADTLFEQGGSAYGSAVVYARDTSGKVLLESHSHFSGAAWVADRRAEMTYASGRLTSVTGYSDGGGRVLLDSLAMRYDGDGNRVEDIRYDDDRELTGRVEYFWRAIPVAVREKRGSESRKAFLTRGRVAFGGLAFDLAGRAALPPR